MTEIDGWSHSLGLVALEFLPVGLAGFASPEVGHVLLNEWLL